MTVVTEVKHLQDLVVLFLDNNLQSRGKAIVVNGQRFDALWPSASVELSDSVAVNPGGNSDSFFLGGTVSIAN